MAQPYVGEIRIFAGNFAPAGWMFCEGQILPISENETLFNLIGTTYGGDGQSTFALPDLRGRLPVHFGNGFTLAESGGAESVTLLTQQIPLHVHGLLASADPANSPNPAAHVLAEAVSTTPYFAGPPAVPLSPQSVANAGGSQPHDNLQPYLCVHYIISLFGIFPSPT
ncbi:MAG TPA: tail fiber protein [Verrucomicrobiae bacterium]|nr:tail fiber protein [Verrucomicrobiae bacterium]